MGEKNPGVVFVSLLLFSLKYLIIYRYFCILIMLFCQVMLWWDHLLLLGWVFCPLAHSIFVTWSIGPSDVIFLSPSTGMFLWVILICSSFSPSFQGSISQAEAAQDDGGKGVFSWATLFLAALLCLSSCRWGQSLVWKRSWVLGGHILWGTPGCLDLFSDWFSYGWAEWGSSFADHSSWVWSSIEVRR